MKKAAGVIKGAGVPNKEKVGTLTQDQIREIAKLKMSDLNAADIDAAAKIIAGTARSMGIARCSKFHLYSGLSFYVEGVTGRRACHG